MIYGAPPRDIWSVPGTGRSTSSEHAAVDLCAVPLPDSDVPEGSYCPFPAESQLTTLTR